MKSITALAVYLMVAAAIVTTIFVGMADVKKTLAPNDVQLEQVMSELNR